MLILQKFGFKDSPYERPQDKWVCGRMTEGNPCLQGPGANGSCQVTTVCQPHLEGERWECRRSTIAGGPCETGPLPDGQCCLTLERCVPKPSLRTVRRRIVVWATALCVGLIALILGSQNAREFLMPGPVSSQHASLTDCQTCHAGVETKDLGWLHSFAAAVKPEDNAKLCIGCHNVGAAPFSPHTNPVDQLRQLTAQYNASGTGRPVNMGSWLHRIALPASNMDGAPGQSKIFCATCHEEHQGTAHNLKIMSNDRCQTCHTSKFGSFAASHPEFSSYPFGRRTRIIFNHKSHHEKHFPKTKEESNADQFVPSNCADCHRPGAAQKYMEIRPYASMCSSCHNGDILGTTRASGPKGIDFLAVPGLDVATLAERGIDIGEWPENSEAELTGFLKALIAIEPKGAQIITGVLQLELQDLSEASDEQLGSVKALAWAFKKLMGRLESTPLSQAMTKLPDNADGSKINQLQMALFTGLIPRDVVMMGNKNWFPDLKDDLEQFAKGNPTKGFAALQDTNSATTQPPPTETKQREKKPAGGEGSILPKSDDAILGGQMSNLEGTDILGEKDGKSDETDILSEKDGKSDETDILSEKDSNSEGSDILGGQDGSLEGADALAQDGALTAAGETSQPDGKDGGKPAQQFDPESWAEFGGWYRQDFTIRYRPYGHSDRILQTWLDYSGQAFGTGQESLLAPVFDQLADRNAVGRCTKCHSIDTEGASKQVRWHAFSSREAKTRFTAFSHAPHIGTSGNQRCALCHKLHTSDADYLKTYKDGDPGKFVPNFTPMDKAVCSTCHTQQTAGETCTQCHNYHASGFNLQMVKSKMP